MIVLFSGNNLHLISQDYFQQEVNYKIEVKLNDVDHELSAFETIEYINNSPDELDYLYFHLWPNAYANNNTALAKQLLEGNKKELFKIKELRGFIDSLDFKINGKEIKWGYDKDNIDICKLYLPVPLKHGEKIVITTPFHVKIPKGVTSRLGHIKQSYQITQWYPKPAVYDNRGWHQMPYLNMGEFYSEFGSFDVSITLPKNYIVGATGNLQNKEEKSWLNYLAKKTAKKDSFEKANTFPQSSKEWKTIRFKQQKVHDFAWFADKRFNVLKGERIMPNTGKKVTTWAMFLNSSSRLWKKSLEYIGDALYFYSKWYGDYPYDQCTAVHSALSAGGGMEYPNITVIGSAGTDLSLETVIAHEVGHNWFYGILGSNERDNVWMDEGINSFSEARYLREKYGNEDRFYKVAGFPEKVADFLDISDISDHGVQQLSYLISARANIDQAPSTHSADYSKLNYEAIAYSKTAIIFDYLYAYLGEEKFNNAMQRYFEEWKYKHPYPEDIQNIFEKTTGEKLSWIFDDLINTTKKLDYKIVKAKNGKVVVKNVGDIVAPVVINGVKNDSTVSSKWFPGFEGRNTLDFPFDKKDIDEIVIDNDEYMVELYRNNNSYRTSGICRKTQALKLKFLGILENNKNTQINYIPVAGWNNYNKFMIGTVFYNSILPWNKFEYQLMPMFSTGSTDIAGYANIAYTFYYYDAIFKSMKFSLSGRRYAYKKKQGDNFNSAKIEMNILLKNKNKKYENRMILNAVAATDPANILIGNKLRYKQYYNFKYQFRYKNKKNPYAISSATQLSDNYAKTSLTVNYSLLFGKNMNIDFRIFAGTFLYKRYNLYNIYKFSLSGETGFNDYLYENTYLGRFESPFTHSFFGNQFTPNNGAFATYIPFGYSDKWLVSFNVSSSIPYMSRLIPLKLFFNSGLMPKNSYPKDYPLDLFNWESGVKFSILQDNIQVFFPVFISKGLKKSNETFTDKYIQRVRFSININNFNLFDIVKKAI